MLVRILAAAGLVVVAMTAPVKGQQARLGAQVINDLFTGIGGNFESIKRGMEATEKLLAEKPDHAEALAWHGAATLASARLQPNLSLGARIPLFQRATAEMNRAVSLEPDNIRVRMARGVILQMETPGMPRFANYTGLVENARADFQRMLDLQKDGLPRLGAHQLGELLQGLGDLYSRQGKADEAARYYGMLSSMLPNTEYARRASQWMKTRQPLPTAQTTCLGCHDARP